MTGRKGLPKMSRTSRILFRFCICSQHIDLARRIPGCPLSVFKDWFWNNCLANHHFEREYGLTEGLAASGDSALSRSL